MIEEHARAEKRVCCIMDGRSRSREVADKNSGHSPNFLGSGDGLYGMALVDVLESYPAADRSLCVYLRVMPTAVVVKVKTATGCVVIYWISRGHRGLPGASASSCLFTRC